MQSLKRIALRHKDHTATKITKNSPSLFVIFVIVVNFVPLPSARLSMFLAVLVGYT